MTNKYSKKVMSHFLNPKNMGQINKPDTVAQVGNPSCGDIMKVYIKFREKNNTEVIEDIKFQTMGCAAAIASSDALCDLAKGKTIQEAKNIKDKDILKALEGLPQVKVHCSMLGASALKKALDNYENKKGGKK